MDVNKLFSIQSNGYSVSEVDDYVSFIQTELTKNMKINRDIQSKNDSLFDSLNQMRTDNKKLSQKNQKLYRDCVAFAKRLKALEVYDNSVEISNADENENSKSLEELKNAYDVLLGENQELKAKLYNATYNSSQNTNNDIYVVNDELNNKKDNSKNNCEQIETQSFIEEDTKPNNSELLENVFDSKTQVKEQVAETDISSNLNVVTDEIINNTSVENNSVLENKSEKLKPLDIDDYNNSLKVDGNKEKKLKNIKSGSSGRRVFKKILNVFVNILLTVSIILGIISLFAYAFIANPELTFINYRAYTIIEDNENLGLTDKDIIIVKSLDSAGIRKNYRVLCKPTQLETRNVKIISNVKNEKGKLNFTVKNSLESTYEKNINNSEILGKVIITLPQIGIISNYAFLHPYSYIAIISCVLILCITIKIIMSIKKSKQRKIKFRDYDMSEFSLDI